MGSVTLPMITDLVGAVGLPGVILILWWLSLKCLWKTINEHRKQTQDLVNTHKGDTQKVLDGYKDTLIQYQKDMNEIRLMYERNVTLVKGYESLATDLREVVTLNTRAMTEACDAIKSNAFCPMARAESK